MRLLMELLELNVFKYEQVVETAGKLQGEEIVRSLTNFMLATIT